MYYLSVIFVNKLNYNVECKILFILTNRNDLNTERPCTPSSPNSRRESATIIKSKIFQPS